MMAQRFRVACRPWGAVAMTTSGPGQPKNESLLDLVCGRRRLLPSEIVGVVLLGVLCGLLLVCVLPEFSGDRNVAANRTLASNNLKQIVIALHNYQEYYGTLPPAVVCNDKGEPLYSWRVALLPFVEEERLYRQFNLDEPWDSPHNAALLPRMPRLYAPVRHPPGAPNHTCCQVFVGGGAAFEGTEGLVLPDDFPDGTANTFLVVEAGDPVPWTKPADLAYAADGALPKLGPPPGGISAWGRPHGFLAAMGDGSVRFVSQESAESTLRIHITRNGGEIHAGDW